MKGTSFTETGNTIVGSLEPVDGVPRMKELPAVTLLET